MFKKLFAVILALILTFGICAVAASAVEIEEPVFNLSFKSGDIVGLGSYENQIKPYLQLGIPVHLNLTFDADTTEPIAGPERVYDDDAYYHFGGIKADSVYADNIVFSGTGPILVDMNNAFSGNKITELYVPFNVYSYNYEYDGYAYAVSEARTTGKPLKSDEAVFMFASNQKLETVTIDNPSDVLFRWAFYNCTSLNSVTFTNKVTAICMGMFQNCTSLENIEIPPTITKICDSAFYNSGLKSITVPSTVTSIEPYALGYQGNSPRSSKYTRFYDGGRGDYSEFINSSPEDYQITKVEGFTIYGESGSEAERYANENGFNFVASDAPENMNKVYSAEVIKEAAVGENAEVSVIVGKNADKIQFINSKGNTTTYTRDHQNVKSIAPLSDYSETWTVNLKTYRPTDNYNVIAKFGRTWVTDDNIQFTLNVKPSSGEKKVYSTKVYLPALMGNYARIYVTVGGSPSKVQLRTAEGSTLTYTRDSINVNKITQYSGYIVGNVDMGTAERWEISVKVNKKSENYIVAAKYDTGWSDETGSIALNELVRSEDPLYISIGKPYYSSLITFNAVTLKNTQRVITGNIFEGTLDGYDFKRESMRYYEDPHFEDYISYIWEPENDPDREVWELNHSIYGCQTMLKALPLYEIHYISAQFADGSWAIAAYHVIEKDGQRYYEAVDLNNYDPQKVNSANVVPQSGNYVDVKVNVGKDASKICFVNSKGGTFTYTPDSSSVKSIEQSGSNDIWTISLNDYKKTETYTVNVKYGRKWVTDSGVSFTVTPQ